MPFKFQGIQWSVLRAKFHNTILGRGRSLIHSTTFTKNLLQQHCPSDTSPAPRPYSKTSETVYELSTAFKKLFSRCFCFGAKDPSFIKIFRFRYEVNFVVYSLPIQFECAERIFHVRILPLLLLENNQAEFFKIS